MFGFESYLQPEERQALVCGR